MFSQTVEYALRAMACLAIHSQTRTASAALAERTQVPADYLAKVLQQLSAAGLIEGRRGVGGGYRLMAAPDKINLLNVVNAVEPIQRIATCPLNIECHGADLCPLHKRIDTAIAGVISAFENSTLEDLIQEGVNSANGGSVPLCDAQQRVNLTVQNGAQPSS